jgi:hypothetical protein
LQQFLAAAALAALTSLGYIAYRHPTGFSRLYFPLIIANAAVLIGCLIWNVSREFLSTAFIPYIPHDKLMASERMVESGNLPMTLIIIISVCFSAYIGFLLLLPYLLREEKQVQKNGHEKDD